MGTEKRSSACGAAFRDRRLPVDIHFNYYKNTIGYRDLIQRCHENELLLWMIPGGYLSFHLDY